MTPPSSKLSIADRKKVMQILADEKVGVVLRPSEKEYGLLHTTSATGNPNQGQAPIATLAREHYQRLWRLSTTGRVTAEVSLEGTFSNAPVTVYNTVAEIRGTEKPDEVVIIGAHLDSWDMATSATDNGTGSMAVLAAARALQKLNVHPKRTIRFILFTGEEEGILGSREYVKAHKNELDKISGVLVDDMGTGKVLTLDLMGNYAARETVDHAMYPLAKVKEIGFAEPSLRIEGGSDHLAFDEADVPGFICLQDPLDYALTHHSQADTPSMCAGMTSPKARKSWPSLPTTWRSFRICCRENRQSLLSNGWKRNTMRMVVQRVSRASVTVESRVTGEIGSGLMVLLGVGKDDTPEVAAAMAEKVANLRIFEDEQGKMNLSLLDVKGAALVVSQFTLYGTTHANGQRRPSFSAAARPEAAVPLYEKFVEVLRGLGVTVATGMFQTTMSVELVNEGPVTILVDSDKTFNQDIT